MFSKVLPGPTTSLHVALPRRFCFLLLVTVGVIGVRAEYAMLDLSIDGVWQEMKKLFACGSDVDGYKKNEC